MGQTLWGPRTAKDGRAAEPAPFPRDGVAQWLSRETVLSVPSVTDGEMEAPAGQRRCPSLEPVFRLPARGLLAQNIPSPLPLPAPAASHGVSPAAAALIRNRPAIQTVCLLRVPVQWYPPPPSQEAVDSREGGRSELKSSGKASLPHNHRNEPSAPLPMCDGSAATAPLPPFPCSALSLGIRISPCISLHSPQRSPLLRAQGAAE